MYSYVGEVFVAYLLVAVFQYATASVVQWSKFLATEIPGSIPGATRFSEK
jgi:hypothetical protein